MGNTEKKIWNAPNPTLPTECYSSGGISPIVSIYKKNLFCDYKHFYVNRHFSLLSIRYSKFSIRYLTSCKDKYGNKK